MSFIERFFSSVSFIRPFHYQRFYCIPLARWLLICTYVIGNSQLSHYSSCTIATNNTMTQSYSHGKWGTASSVIPLGPAQRPEFIIKGPERDKGRRLPRTQLHQAQHAEIALHLGVPWFGRNVSQSTVPAAAMVGCSHTHSWMAVHLASYN